MNFRKHHLHLLRKKGYSKYILRFLKRFRNRQCHLLSDPQVRGFWACEFAAHVCLRYPNLARLVGCLSEPTTCDPSAPCLLQHILYTCKTSVLPRRAYLHLWSTEWGATSLASYADFTSPVSRCREMLTPCGGCSLRHVSSVQSNLLIAGLRQQCLRPRMLNKTLM